MRKALKILAITISALCLLFFVALSYFYIQTSEAKLDTSKLVSFNQSISFYDDNGTLIQEQSNGKTLAEISKIPTHTKNAFIAVEDKRFYKHNGTHYEHRNEEKAQEQPRIRI